MNECELCGRDINVRTDAHFDHIEGWVKGGRRGNAVMWPERDGRTRCSTCMGRESRIPGQEELF